MSSPSPASPSVPGLWDEDSSKATFQEPVATWRFQLCSDYLHNRNAVVTAIEHKKQHGLWEHEFLAVFIHDKGSGQETVVFIDRDFDDKKPEELPSTTTLVC